MHYCHRYLCEDISTFFYISTEDVMQISKFWGLLHFSNKTNCPVKVPASCLLCIFSLICNDDYTGTYETHSLWLYFVEQLDSGRIWAYRCYLYIYITWQLKISTWQLTGRERRWSQGSTEMLLEKFKKGLWTINWFSLPVKVLIVFVFFLRYWICCANSMPLEVFKIWVV